MRRVLLFLIVALGLNTAMCMAQDIVGYWGGELDVQGVKLEVFFDIAKGSNGYESKLDVPVQGARGVKVDATTFNGMDVGMEIKSLGVTFKGIYAYGIITGTFSQNGYNLPLTLRKAQRIVTIRPQEPKAPFPYKAEEVKFKNTKEGITLAGTLTTPEGNGKVPAVVLITGSGQQNRDEEMFEHKPFAVIADYLSRRGIAVLRFDDRGMGSSEQGKADATTLDLSYDAEAAVNFLKETGRFSSVGVLGHSEGCIISFMLGARKLTDFVVSLSGPAVKGSEILSAQQDSLYRLMGMPRETINAMKSTFKDCFLIIDNSETVAGARPEIESLVSTLPEQVRTELVNQFMNPWMFFFCKYNPARDIAMTECPALIINGKKDMQVPYSQNVPVYRRIAAEHPNTRFEIHEIDGLNHLLQHCATGNTTEYITIDETIAPEVLDLIAIFISKRK